MASEMLGRAKCPECGFDHAHIKIKTDKEGAHPYRHCPDCGSQYFTKNKLQGDMLRAKVRAVAVVPEQNNHVSGKGEGGEVIAAPEAKNPPPVEPKKTKMVFGVEVPA